MGIRVGGHVGPVGASVGMSGRQAEGAIIGLFQVILIAVLVFVAAPIAGLIGLILLARRRVVAGSILLLLGGGITWWAWPLYADATHRISGVSSSAKPIKSIEFKDGSDYRFRADLTKADIRAEVGDMKDAAPGSADIQVVIDVEGRLHNLTSNRTAPAPYGVEVVPVWNGKSVVCQAEGDVHAIYDGKSWDNWCTVGNNSNGLSFAVGLGDKIDASSYKSVFEVESVALSVPEASANQAVAKLKVPDEWRMVLGGSTLEKSSPE